MRLPIRGQMGSNYSVLLCTYVGRVDPLPFPAFTTDCIRTTPHFLGNGLAYHWVSILLSRHLRHTPRF